MRHVLLRSAVLPLILAVAGVLCTAGCATPREVARSAATTTASPPTATPTPAWAYPLPGASTETFPYPLPDAPPSPTAMPEDATPYPEPPQPTSTDTPWPTDTLSPDDLTIIAELTEAASYTATPTPTPLPPTPTATPLPPLDPELETMLYAVQGERGPELMRLQVDAEGRPAGPPQAFTPPTYRHARVSIPVLCPSPVGRYVAFLYAYADQVTTALLDTQDWSIDWLMPDPLDDGLWATPRFLDWSPDGRSVLLRGSINDWPEDEELWLLNLEDHEYRVLPALEGSAPYSEGRTAFAPDGRAVAVAIDHYLGGRVLGEAWIIPPEGEAPYRIAEGLGEHGPVQWIGWSPRGDALALAIQRDTAFTNADVVGCELWYTPLGSGSSRSLGHLSVDRTAAWYLEPLWQSDGQRIVYVRSWADRDTELWGEFTSNLYRVDVATGETTALTAFDDTAVVAPHWAPGGALTFATGNVQGEPLPVWWLRLDADGLPLGEPEMMPGPILTGGHRVTAPGIVWLPRADDDEVSP